MLHYHESAVVGKAGGSICVNHRPIRDGADFIERLAVRIAV